MDPIARFYLTVFAYQATPKRPKSSHTFAVFTRAAGEVHGGEGPIDHYTISWLPTDLKVNVFRLWPKEGKNLDLDTTLELARKQNLRVSTWGPFRIKQELFDLGMRQIDFLQSGAIRFVSLDTILRRTGTAINCIHAISDLEPKRRLRTGTAHGESASKMVVDHLRLWFHDTEEDTAWLREHLGLHSFAVGV